MLYALVSLTYFPAVSALLDLFLCYDYDSHSHSQLSMGEQANLVVVKEERTLIHYFWLSLP